MVSNAKHSPTPWSRSYSGVLDADGLVVCVCQRDSLHGMDDDETAKADAALIVEAVREHIARHRMIDVETYDYIYRERDKLRDLVRRMMPCVKERAEEWIRETDNPMGSSCGRMWRETASKEAARLSALLAEAKEAVGEEGGDGGR